MIAMDGDLNELKQAVNLPEYAASKGYWVDKRKSCRRSLVMRHDNGDKIVLSQGSKCWIYFSARDDRDNGTIVDFIQHRQSSKNLGLVKKELRRWLGRPQTSNSESPKYGYLKKKDVFDEKSMEIYLNRVKPIENIRYLKGRYITSKVIYGPRFKGTIHQDYRNNTVFLHRNFKGICGAEQKNVDFTGCPTGSTKGIWHSNILSEDNQLVICESAIDCLSYHILYGKDRDRYISTGGNFSPNQQELLRRVIEKMPEGSCIVSAFDNDREGRKYDEKILAMVPQDKNYERHIPVQKDWNDDLKQRCENKNSVREYAKLKAE